MQNEIKVKIPEAFASVDVSIVCNGKEVARIYAFCDGDLFINAGNVVRVRSDNVESNKMSITSLTDRNIVYWHEIQLKKSS